MTKDLSHKLSPDFLKNAVVKADVVEALSLIPTESVHLTFTSPPYFNARDYAHFPTYQDYLLFLRRTFSEVYRVTKPGRFCIVNTSPIIIPRPSRCLSSKRFPIPYDLHPILTKMGWEFVDDIVWEKPEACVKNRCGSFYYHRNPLAYKPNPVTEMIMVYRRSDNRLIDWNIRQYDKETIQRSKVKTFERTNVWKIAPAKDRVHSAVFPVDLANKIVRCYSVEGDLLFDPFAGSGTIGVAAIMAQRYFLLIERNDKYVERAFERFEESRDLTSDVLSPRLLTLESLKEWSEREKTKPKTGSPGPVHQKNTHTRCGNEEARLCPAT